MTTDHTQARDLLRDALDRSLVVFTGAGLSRRPPASLPVNKDLLGAASEILSGVVHHPHFGTDQEESLELAGATRTMPLEHFFETLVKAVGPHALRLMDIFRGGMPNDDHLAVARLCAERPHWMFTLNFDSLLESAVTRVTGRAVLSVADLEAFTTIRLNGAPQHPTIFHLHGMLDQGVGFAGISTTLASIRTRLHTSRARVLREAVARHPILCLGYGNGDIDTFPILAEGAHGVFWYQHDDTLPSEIDSPNRPFRDRLVILKRQPNEPGIAEVLSSARPSWRGVPITAEDKEVESVETRRERFADGLRVLLDSTGSPLRAVRFMLASVAADRGRFKLAIGLLTTSGEGAPSSSVLHTNEQLLLGHCCELDGQQRVAHHVFRHLGSHAAGESWDLARLHRASAALGNWKGNPARLLDLNRWLQTVRSLRGVQSAPVQHRRQFEIGDFFQFLGERLFVPSAAIAALRPKAEVRGRLFVRVADAMAQGILGRWRIQWMRRAALEYLRLVRTARLNPIDPATGYTVLAQLRFIECRVSTPDGALPMFCLSWITHGEHYYRWARSSHGLGNASCTRAIVAMHLGRFHEAEDSLREALERYGDHTAGIRKVAICRWRLALLMTSG